LALNPEITKLDPKTPISDLKIPLLNLQLNESDQQMKKEYEEVVKWLLYDLEKTYGKEATCTKGNDENYNLISRLKSLPKDALLQWQRKGRLQSLSLEYLQALVMQKKT
jgi:hypothetical protein